MSFLLRQMCLLSVLVLSLSAASGCEAATPAAGEVKKTDILPKAEFLKLRVKTASESLPFDVEVASTNKMRSLGLMHRTQMDVDKGMIFIFDKSRVQSFWMKNTRLPLDMFFIDENKKIVGMVENAEPMTLTSRSCGKASLYVLELNAGAARKFGIAVGDVVSFDDVTAKRVGEQNAEVAKNSAMKRLK